MSALRRRLAALAGAVFLVGAAALSVVLWPAHAQITRISADGDAVRLVDSRDGSAIFTIAGLAPGGSGEGTVTLSNSGVLPASLSLSIKNLVDVPGPNGGALSQALTLSVVDVTDAGQPRTLYDEGRFVPGQTIDIGSLAPEGSRTFKLIVEFPDGGRPADQRSGDNAFMGSVMRVDLGWTGTGGGDDGTPPGQAPPPGTPTQMTPTHVVPSPHSARPVVNVPLSAASASARRPASRCMSRRHFTIRLVKPRGSALRRARVVVNGHAVRVVRIHHRLTARIDLRGRRGVAHVRISARTRTGRRLFGTRVYHLCTRRRPGRRPRL